MYHEYGAIGPQKELDVGSVGLERRLRTGYNGKDNGRLSEKRGQKYDLTDRWMRRSQTLVCQTVMVVAVMTTNM